MFLLSLRAAGTGLNLTNASYVVLYDPWWNPAVEAQAIDRSHRIGQTQTVNAYRLIAPGTVEEKIWELQQSKAQTIADVLGEEGFARSLSNRSGIFVLRRLGDFRLCFLATFDLVKAWPFASLPKDRKTEPPVDVR